MLNNRIMSSTLTSTIGRGVFCVPCCRELSHHALISGSPRCCLPTICWPLWQIQQRHLQQANLHPAAQSPLGHVRTNSIFRSIPPPSMPWHPISMAMPLKMQVAWPVPGREVASGFLALLCFALFCLVRVLLAVEFVGFVGPPSLRFVRLFRFYLTFLAFAPLIGRKYQKWQCMTTMFIMIIMLPHDHPHDRHDQHCPLPPSLLWAMSMAMVRIRTLMSGMPFVRCPSLALFDCLPMPSAGTAPKRDIDRSIDIAQN